MSVIYVLLAISLIVAIIFFIAFIASVRSGQYDDSYTPSVRMLFEDELVGNSQKKSPTDLETKLEGAHPNPEKEKKQITACRPTKKLSRYSSDDLETNGEGARLTAKTKANTLKNTSQLNKQV